MHPRSSLALKFMPSFMDIVLLAPIALLCSRVQGAKALLGDGDTGWHIRTGEWILANQKVPFTDMFSFTKPGETWFAWEWLWDAAFFLLHSWGGMAAVLFASVAILSGTFALLYSQATAKSGNAVFAALITLCAVMASSIHWLARPHLVTLFFVAVFMGVLEKGSRRSLLVLLPALMILWTNLHGGFAFGLILLSLYIAGGAAEYLNAPPGLTRDMAGAALKVKICSLLLCVSATFCNPYGYLLHQHVISYLADGYQMATIAEFQSLSFHHPMSRVVELLLLLGTATACWSFVYGRFTHVLLLLTWAHLALVSSRNIPIFAIVAAPLIAAAMQNCLIYTGTVLQNSKLRDLVNRIGAFTTNISLAERTSRFHLASVGAFAIFGFLLFGATPPERLVAQYDEHDYPARAVDKLSTVSGTGRIFSTDVWGGYLIYRMYPQRKVFVDGRSDFYGPAFGESYSDVMNVKPGWEARLREYGIDTVLVPASSFLSGALKESKNWKCSYDDGIAVVFRPVGINLANNKQVSIAIASEREAAKWLPRSSPDKFREKTMERLKGLGGPEAI